jgi:hypothetical protein
MCLEGATLTHLDVGPGLLHPLDHSEPECFGSASGVAAIDDE